jgi:hypothetical protein
MGLLVMGMSIACEAIRMLLMQKLFVGKVRFTVVESLYYIGPARWDAGVAGLAFASNEKE